ncbi:MAG: mechanosensitive ion channel [Ichthyobacteriaceae bacterium]|nr:mechanosensitive ion channel [Ichthyobacteriaceae bacterium]
MDNYVMPFFDKKFTSIKYWNRFKIIVWIFAISIFYYKLVHYNLIITLVFTVIIIGVGWDYWKSVFNGTLIKFEGKMHIGDNIITDFVTGEIKKINLANTEVVNDNGEVTVVPNSKLQEVAIKRLNEKNKTKTHRFSVEISDVKTSDDVYKLAVNCPYISVHQKIKVRKTEEGNYYVLASVVDKVFMEKTCNYFKGVN